MKIAARMKGTPEGVSSQVSQTYRQSARRALGEGDIPGAVKYLVQAILSDPNVALLPAPTPALVDVLDAPAAQTTRFLLGEAASGLKSLIPQPIADFLRNTLGLARVGSSSNPQLWRASPYSPALTEVTVPAQRALLNVGAEELTHGAQQLHPLGPEMSLHLVDTALRSAAGQDLSMALSRMYNTMNPYSLGMEMLGKSVAERLLLPELLRAEASAIDQVFPGQPQRVVDIMREQAQIANMLRKLRHTEPTFQRALNDVIDAFGLPAPGP